MRGIVTLAAALALPAGFPFRDLILLIAFSVVLGTLALQGLTLGPLINRLGIEDDGQESHEDTLARRRVAEAALARLEELGEPDWISPESVGRARQLFDYRQRRFTANEFDALIRAHGGFDIVEWLGSLAPAVPFNNDAKAWRMVPVLRKRAVHV